MPIYEYRCGQCRKKSSVLVLSYREVVHHRCPHCGSEDASRIMSRFATIRSEEDRLGSLADSPALSDIDEHDPVSVARAMKTMGRELGDEFGDDVEAALDEAAAGEGPDGPGTDEELLP